MKRYTGIPCVCCREVFKDEDDVVVCPICGAPHHRDCYIKNGQCSLADKHASGEVWQPSGGASGESRGEQAVCPNCQASNPKQSQYCQMCGTRLHTTFQERREPPRAPVGGFTPPPGTVYTGNVDNTDQWEIQGVSAREISTYIGNNSHYYLRQFRTMQMNATRWSWNWSAFFFGPFFLLYRKMYLFGAMILAVCALCSIPSFVYFFEYVKMSAPEFGGLTLSYSAKLMENMAFMSRIGQAFMYILMGLQALYANRMFMEKVMSDIKAVRKQMPGGSGSREYYTRLFFAGRPNRMVVTMTGCLIISFILIFFQYTQSVIQIPVQLMMFRWPHS